MNNLELEQLLNDLPVKVCCSDDLPMKVRVRPKTYVVNTDLCSGKGIHWVVFHFPKSGNSEFFDSLGERPETYRRRFKDVLIANGSYLLTLDQIQPKFSDTCGIYCVLFVRKRYGGLSFRNIMKGFNTKHLDGNDEKALKFIRGGWKKRVDRDGGRRYRTR